MTSPRSRDGGESFIVLLHLGMKVLSFFFFTTINMFWNMCPKPFVKNKSCLFLFISSFHVLKKTEDNCLAAFSSFPVFHSSNAGVQSLTMSGLDNPCRLLKLHFLSAVHNSCKKVSLSSIISQLYTSELGSDSWLHYTLKVLI